MAGGEALFEQVTRLDRLEAAFRKVEGNAGGPGGDGMTVEEFGVDLALRLVRLQLSLRAGSYRPGPVREAAIPKPVGGERRLRIPCVGDRVAQTAAAMILTSVLDPELHDASFAYRPGRSVQQAVARIARNRRDGYGWVVEGDIERFFDAVPHALLLPRLQTLIPDARLVELIELWLETMGEGGRGLPQGAPISPLLANLYLDAVDDAIHGSGVRLVRFADDFLLMCRTPARAERALEDIRALLADYGLLLVPEKTRIVRFEQGFRFLGHLFVRSLVLKETEPPDEDPFALLAGAAPLLEAPPPVPDAPSSDATDGLSPGLRVLYLMEPNRELAAEGQTLAVREDGRALLRLAPVTVGRIELGPRASAQTAALRLALAHRIPVAFTDGHGRTHGTLAHLNGHRPELHLAQARAILEPARRLELARAIVHGRLHNSRALLRRLNRRRKRPEVVDAVLAINRGLRRLPAAATVETCLGLEGEGAARYWPALGLCLEHGFGLRHRRRRPPPDPVNLVVSFLTSLLYRDLEAVVLRAGLHPGFAVLHAAEDGRPNCVLDLIEAFRAPLAEGLCAYLINNRQLAPADFATGEGGGCRLLADAGQRMVRAYEAWLDRPIMSPHSRRRVLWRQLMAEEVWAYARALREGNPFSPYAMDY